MNPAQMNLFSDVQHVAIVGGTFLVSQYIVYNIQTIPAPGETKGYGSGWWANLSACVFKVLAGLPSALACAARYLLWLLKAARGFLMKKAE
ncbi:hypothetical protein NLJ89_g6079 [Agrocybe chaxingu]|uniref:Uncharacterized protein n=1 Tax=Agrocybe chaxingu TaxID=84603 RepID=A0A9W8K1D7_9AGAR|nr:hypothetical protein NLJ89_g6079 [Agrocybe chaxingu]